MFGFTEKAACPGIVAPATPHCVPSIPAPTPPPNFDALAASLTAQGNAIAAQANYLTFATLALGVIAVFLTLGWGILVKIWAEKAAKDAVSEWMNKYATDEISKIVANIIPSSVDGGGVSSRPPMTQEEQEKGLGGDPAKDTG